MGNDDATAVPGPRLHVPIFVKADEGLGSAVSVHLLPNEIDCESVVFAGDDVDPGGYTISLDRLRKDPDRVVQHLAQKKKRATGLGMLIAALDRKR